MPRVGLDRGDDLVRGMWGELINESGNDPAPLVLSLTKGGKDRVVQIEQNGCRKLTQSTAYTIT